MAINRMRTLVVMIAVAQASVMTGQAQERAVAGAPSSETVLQMSDVVSGAFQRMTELRKYLAATGDPTKRKQDKNTGAYLETPEEHLERVELSIRIQGIIIVALHQEFERTLEAKYMMENAFRLYEAWMADIGEDLDNRPGRYRGEINKLDQGIGNDSADIVVLAFVTEKQARQEGNQAMAERMGELYDESLIAQITDFESRESRFDAFKTLAEKEGTLRDLVARMKAQKWERDYLERVGIPRAEGFKTSLPESHREAYAVVAATLTQNKEELQRFEDMADQVAAMAKVAMDELQLVRPEYIKTHGKLNTEDQQRLEKSQSLLTENLDAFTGLIGKNDLAGASIFAGGSLKSMLADNLQSPTTEKSTSHERPSIPATNDTKEE